MFHFSGSQGCSILEHSGFGAELSGICTPYILAKKSVAKCVLGRLRRGRVPSRRIQETDAPGKFWP